MEEDGSVEMFNQMQQGQQGGAPAAEPIDNTVEIDNQQESPTPQLDSEVEKYSSGINKQ
jgi:hypothetical protein